jgi:LemA protein
MNSKTIRTLIIVGVVLIAFLWIRGSYNGLVNQDETLSNAWNNVEVAYQNRADKIAEVAEAVSAEAKFEKSTLTEITNARASAGQVKLTSDQLTPENLSKFESAQQSAFSRMMIVLERYPDLKATKGYENLQYEISEAENMIRTARSDFNTAVKQYNLSVRQFPSNIFAGIFGFEKKSGFAADKGSEKRVNVKDALNGE